LVGSVHICAPRVAGEAGTHVNQHECPDDSVRHHASGKQQMTSKDKPKRGGAKHFDRETKPRDPAKAGAGKKGFSAKAGLGPRKPRAEDAAVDRPAGKRPSRPSGERPTGERPARKLAA